MPLHLVAYFFGGAFTANAIPHLTRGTSGKHFHSPFAAPPFRGVSSPTVNVAWGLFNLAVAYLLLVQVGAFDLRNWFHFGVCFAGFGTMGFQCASSVGRMHRQRDGEATPTRAVNS